MHVESNKVNSETEPAVVTGAGGGGNEAGLVVGHSPAAPDEHVLGV